MGDAMDDSMRRLLKAVKAITPHGTISLKGVPHPVTGNGDHWHGMISVGNIVIADHIGDMNEIIEELTHRLDAVADRLKSGLANTEPPPDID
jgi:hypothetical protein